jgi:ABC-type nitrate/sulfonate/bicarbonate transport system permease component
MNFTLFSPLIGVILLLLGWQALAMSGWINPVLLPTPIATLTELVRSVGQSEQNLAIDLLRTLVRTVEAVAIATLLGIPFGMFLGSSLTLYRSLEFIIDFFRSMPATALIPLVIVLFGIQEFSKVVIAAFTAFLMLTFYSAYGVIYARRSRLLAAQAMGANRWQIFKDVLLWESLPQILVGVRSAISLALVIVIVSEMLMGAEVGLGKRILYAEQVLQVEEMYAAILLTGGLGYGLNLSCLWFERRIVHWSGK